MHLSCVCRLFLALFSLFPLWKVGGCWSLVNEYLGPMPHGEPDLLARFYSPFLSCPGLNTVSCWPHGCNVVPCPSTRRMGWGGGVGGVCNWACAKKVLLRPQAYVAMWRQAAQGEKKGNQCFWVALSKSCALCCKINNHLRLHSR